MVSLASQGAMGGRGRVGRTCAAVVLVVHLLNQCGSSRESHLQAFTSMLRRQLGGLHRDPRCSARHYTATVPAVPAIEVDEGVNVWSNRPLGDTREEVWHYASDAALESFRKGANVSTIVLPSGAGDIVVGLKIVAGLLQDGKLKRALVVAPPALLAEALEVYTHEDWQARGLDVRVAGLNHTVTGVRQLAATLKEDSKATIVVIEYADMQRVVLAQQQSKVPAFDLIVFESAHIVRAGGYREAGLNDFVQTKRRVFISARRLAGRAPGALLAPGQEAEAPAPTIEPKTKFGDEVYRLPHEDAVQKGLTVPIRLVFLKAVDVSAVAQQLAELHKETGVVNFQVVPDRGRFVQVLDKLLGNLTNGACSVGRSGGRVDVIIAAGMTPNFVQLAELFPLLARPAPGKSGGFLVVAGDTKSHLAAAWRALAIEDQDAEEAIQSAAVEVGRRDKRLAWEEVPRILQKFVHESRDMDMAEVHIARVVQILGHPWDTWFGRLTAYKEQHGNVKVSFMKMIFGYQLGIWVTEQRERWEKGLLDQWQVARLKGLGFLFDIDGDMFAQGLVELRKYVTTRQSRVVPLSYVTDSGFRLGEWVVEQRTLQRRGRLPERRKQLLQEAFFMWQPSEELPSSIFNHPLDPEYAEVTRKIEAELRAVRWKTIQERRRALRTLVLTYHPDLWEDKRAGAAIQFLSDVKEWFLAGS